MTSITRFFSLPAAILLAVTVMTPLLGSAQVISNGYACAPKNPGGEETRLYFRQQDGVAINLSQTATFPVVCPVIIEFGYEDYYTAVALKNGSNATQDFACALEEYNLETVKVRSTGRSIAVPAGQTGFIEYSPIFLANPTNYLSLRCILPPRGMVGEVVWW